MNCINLPKFRVIKAEENEFDYRFTVETSVNEENLVPLLLIDDHKVKNNITKAMQSRSVA